jgi:hypothetical protein
MMLWDAIPDTGFRKCAPQKPHGKCLARLPTAYLLRAGSRAVACNGRRIVALAASLLLQLM